jgi:hypothetical protein
MGKYGALTRAPAKHLQIPYYRTTTLQLMSRGQSRNGLRILVLDLMMLMCQHNLEKFGTGEWAYRGG